MALAAELEDALRREGERAAAELPGASGPDQVRVEARWGVLRRLWWAITGR